MIDLVAITSTAVAFFVVTASPGPATLSCATVAMSRGRKAGLLHGLGLACGLAFWGVIAACGVGALLQGSIYLLMVLKLLGAVYLFRLALLSARAAQRGDSTSAAAMPERRWFYSGVLLNLSNPKAVFAWMAALSIGLDGSDGLAVVSVATALCVAVGFASYALYAMLFSIGGIMRIYRRGHRAINGAVSALFALAGAGLVRSALASQTTS